MREALALRPTGTTAQLRAVIAERYGLVLRPGDIIAAVAHLRQRRFDPAGLGPRLLAVLPILVERLGPAAMVKIISVAGPAGRPIQASNGMSSGSPT